MTCGNVSTAITHISTDEESSFLGASNLKGQTQIQKNVKQC